MSPTLVTEQNHPECYCQLCGGVNTHWVAPSSIWNGIMSGAEYGIVCPNCFIKLAERKGITIWFAAVPLGKLDECLNEAVTDEHN